MADKINVQELREQARAQRDELGFDYSPVEHGTLTALLDAVEAAQDLPGHCSTCYGDGWVERPERVIGESDDPCPTCDPLRTALDRFTFDST